MQRIRYYPTISGRLSALSQSELEVSLSVTDRASSATSRNATSRSLGEGHSPAILGEPGDAALLGVVTLENLGLVFNPFTRTLHPMRLLLVTMGEVNGKRQGILPGRSLEHARKRARQHVPVNRRKFDVAQMW